MHAAPFDADLWLAQNCFYDVMISVSSLARDQHAREWLQHFYELGESLGIAAPKVIPAADAPVIPPVRPLSDSMRTTDGVMANTASLSAAVTSPFDAAAQ
jgi:hypothetical protein